MSLLNQKDIDHALAAVKLRRSRRSETLQRALYGVNGSLTPVGFVKLEKPEERELWAQHVRRQALAESEGRVESQAATQVLPEVQ